MTIALLLVAFGVGWRLLVSPEMLTLPNFVPLSAIALYAAMHLPRRLAMAVPLAVLLISDLVLDQMHGYAFFPLSRLTTYALFMGVALGGSFLPRKLGLPARIGTALGGSILFFLVSNFAVWMGGEGFGYPQTLSGLMSSYAVALPFFRNMLMAEVLGASALYAIDAMRARQASGEVASSQVSE